ncbi:MAG: hypothetical protein JKY52_20780, partial [Flavobacteriales bacterium]|nr:hypothetical protein [Flavobacteriales bacterium]
MSEHQPNKSRIYLIRKIQLVLILSLLGLPALAGVEVFTERLSAAQYNASTTQFSVTDDKLVQVLAGSVAFSDLIVTNRVILGVDPGSLVHITGTYDLSFDLIITSIDATGALSTISKTLDVAYDDSGPYVDKSIYELSGGHKVTIDVDKVYVTGDATKTPVSPIPGNIFLEVEIEIERYPLFVANAIPVPGIISQAYNVLSDELELSWDYISGAEEYDLEWLHVDDYAVDGTPKNKADIEYDFKNDATRITTSFNTYSMPLVFERGYILYRLRGTARGTASFDKMVIGPWSSDNYQGQKVVSNYPDNYPIPSGHEVDKNWQYTVVFAEDGKSRGGVNYFDGSLRSRQSVSKLNTEEKAIVGENIYDYQGRAAIQVLPVPVADSKIKYYEAFNQNTIDLPYDRDDFDIDFTTPCNPDLGIMKADITGASHYYSSFNLQQEQHQAFLPDAQGFPFTQIEYTPDNTGRVRRQSGVGADHKMGSGRETKYYYSKPSQKQLDRLFGSEVGIESHYKKNMVIDANGQKSVSYLDLSGRVIATALAGAAPGNLTELASYDPLGTDVTDDLFAKDADGISTNNQVSIEGDALIYSSELMVTTAGNYDFTYKITPAVYTDACLLGTICFDCAYDLEISITDECFNEMITAGPISQYVGSVILDTDCDAPLTLAFEVTQPAFTVPLSVGAYTITKKLTVNREAINFYKDEYVLGTNGTCGKELQTFIDSAVAAIDNSGCDITCVDCLAELGVVADYETPEEFELAKTACDDLCDTINLCRATYEMMLIDMNPGGQYALYNEDLNTGVVTAHPYPLSVLNSNNQFPETNSWWRYPIITGGTNLYFNADGSEARIDYTSGFPAVVTNCISCDGITVAPHDLLNLEDFITFWEPSWAISLVEYHPEYCYYEWCSRNDIRLANQDYSSDDFDYTILNMNLSEAQAYFGTGLDIRVQDPYFTVGQGTGYNQRMSDLMLNFNDPSSPYSIYQMVYYSTQCGTIYNDPTQTATCMNACSTVSCYINDDDAWERLVSMYLSVKQELQQEAADIDARDICGKWNGCIGETHAEYFDDIFITMVDLSSFLSLPYFDAGQPCSNGTYALYANKIRRFADRSSLPGGKTSSTNQALLDEMQNTIDFDLFLQTGQCPLTRDVQHLLDALADRDGLIAISPGTSLIGYPQFTEDFYNEVVDPAAMSFIGYSWVTAPLSGTNKQLTIDILGASGADLCNTDIILTFDPASAYDFTFDIEGFNQLVYTGTGTDHQFTIVALIDDDADPLTLPITETLTGTTCIDIDISTCTFNDVCKANGAASDLEVLMNALATLDEDGVNGTDLTTGNPGMDLSTSNYNNLFSPLQPYLSPANDWKWLYAGAGTGLFTILASTGPDMVIQFDDPSFNFSIITSVSNLGPDPAGPNNNNFIVTFGDGTNSWPLTGTINIIDGVTTAFNVGKCGPPNSLLCATKEHQTTDDLEVFLDALLGETTHPFLSGADLDLAYVPEFIPLEGLSGAVQDPHWEYQSDDGMELTATISGLHLVNGSNVRLTSCDFTLTFQNSGHPYDFKDITSLSEIHVIEGNPVGGYDYSFTILAKDGNDVEEILTGTSCFAIRNCVTCRYGVPGVELVADPDFELSSATPPGTIQFNSSYTFGACPQNNTSEYGLVTDATPCDVTAIGLDHTDPGNGYFMLVNVGQLATPTRDLIWQETTPITVTKHADYTFSAWYALNNIPGGAAAPKIDLDINGTVVSSVLSFGTKAEGFWYQITGTWNSGYASTADISIQVTRNNAEKTLIGLDDISFKKSCSASPPVYVEPQSQAYVNPCVDYLLDIATFNATNEYNAYIESIKATFEEDYITKCLEAAEIFTVDYNDLEHHYTLYYYDQAGNLIRTVPPEGVVLSTDFAQINADRTYGTREHLTQHTLTTTYSYNSLNQLVSQTVPDHEALRAWDESPGSGIPVGNTIFGSEFTSGTNGFVMTDDPSGNGHMYTTADGGTTWTEITTVGTTNLNAVQYSTGLTPAIAWAVGDKGILLKSIDAGQTWDLLSVPTTKDLVQLYFLDDDLGRVFAKDGSTWATANGGASWLVVAGITGLTGNITDVHFLNTSDGIAVSDAAVGEIVYTSDGGGSWNPGTLTTGAGPLHGVFQVDANVGYAVGDNGTILKTGNSGMTWDVDLFPGMFTENFKDVYFSSPTSGIVVGSMGRVLEGDGSLWTAPFRVTAEDLNAVSLTGPTTGYIGGGSPNTTMLKADPDLNTWTVQSPLTSIESVRGMDAGLFTGPDQLLAVGDVGTIWNSTDDGVTWQAVNTVSMPVLYDAQMINSTTGFAVGVGGNILTTTDGGASWNTQSSGISQDLNAVSFYDASNGVAVGDLGEWTYTSNGGTLWNPQSMGGANLNDVFMVSATLGVLVGDVGLMKINTTGLPGAWNQPTGPFPAITDNLHALYFVDETLGFAVGANGRVLKITLNGTTWANVSQTQILTSSTLRSVHFLDHNIGYITGDGNVILTTIDGGNTWELKTLSSASYDILSVEFTDNNNAYFTGTGGNITQLNVLNDDISTRFWYDRLGRLVVSQNTKQHVKNPLTYSYTQYDALGRIIEVGEILATNAIGDQYVNGVLDDTRFSTWLTTGAKTEITHTHYDVPAFTVLIFTQENLRTRVASVTFEETDDNNLLTFSHATHYSYDIHGNVTTLVQDNPSLISYGHQYKRTDYEYDLVSGNVNVVKYQDGERDQFFHKYEYDADNRITNVHTSAKGSSLSEMVTMNGDAAWEQDAKYQYYQHGPLARTEIGDQKVQGLDYAYTIQGWLKGVNSNILNETVDMGEDGDLLLADPLRVYSARDAFGYSLGYFGNDYTAIGGTQDFLASIASPMGSYLGVVGTDGPDLYNGNISHMVTSIIDIDAGSGTFGEAIPQLTAYKYDQLNRIKQMKAHRDIVGNAWGNGSTYDESYESVFTYDANGNILTLKRNGLLGTGTALAMDDMSYQYDWIDPLNHSKGKRSNKLYHVDDITSAYNTDIDDQGTFVDDPQTINDVNNYRYDEIGNLTKDVQENIVNINWTVYGKVSEVIKTVDFSDLEFRYDANGNRIAKIEKTKDSNGILKDPSLWNNTYYALDASGNTMATYKLKESDEDFYLDAWMLYGSSRLGVKNVDLPVARLSDPAVTDTYTHTLGKRQFELSNHLGNVLTVVSDRKESHDDFSYDFNSGGGNWTQVNGKFTFTPPLLGTHDRIPGGDGVIDYFTADITSAQDYYAFGSIMPQRSGAFNSDYRCGFNGKEKDDETSG